MKHIQKLILTTLVSSQILTYALSARADDSADAQNAAKPPLAEKAPPLPLHTIDGVGGILITPIAYLVNPGPEGTKVGLPAISATYVNARRKNVSSFVITETLWRRVELGFSASRFGLGSLPTAIQRAVGADIGRSDVWLYNLNARVLALPENSFDLPTPALTLGLQAKINDGIETIDRNTGGALTGIGLRHKAGVDFVATSTKMFPKFIGRPLLISAGLRLSTADQLGYVGFGNTYRPSFEVNTAYSVKDWLWLAFEYRQKRNPYGNVGTLVRKESDWWTAGAGFVLNSHTTATVGYGHFGNVLNTVENSAWAVSLKYEF